MSVDDRLAKLARQLARTASQLAASAISAEVSTPHLLDVDPTGDARGQRAVPIAVTVDRGQLWVTTDVNW
ncbi:MAG: hypothetical protein IPM99_07235 [Rubrivivax sp.]|nr:hypothetical protein [Rubrivivax sp.]